MKDRQFDDPFEKSLKDALDQHTKSVTLSDDKRRELLSCIRQEQKENKDMKHISKRKLILAVAAMCIMTTMAVAAAGKIVYTATSSNRDNPTYREFEEIKAAEDKLGQPIHTVRQFENGMLFENGYLLDVKCMDEQHNQIDTYPELKLLYRTGDKKVSLDISKPVSGWDSGEPDSTETYDGKELKYSVESYLFLPPDAKPSAEDQALEEAGELYISYGSQEEERKDIYNVYWEEGELVYLMLSWDVGGEELMAMAREVVGAENLK